MASNVIRQDVIQVGVKTDVEPLQALAKELQQLKKMITGLDFDKPAEEADKLGKTDTSKLKKSLEHIKDSLNNIGKKSAKVAFDGLKKVASVSFKALTVSIGGAVAGLGAVAKKSIEAYSEFEQLKGGVETLFKDSSGTVMKYANDAYKTAGLSANNYMETVTSFSASLLQSLGGDTKKASEYSNTAIIDMADNANKMGTDIESLQNAYQGFAKQNYTMLDNLKLGYGGTKEEMSRLIKDASKIDKSIKSNDTSFGNIVKAIHAVQENMGITGTTAKEASTTIQGSLSSMKSAWGNLLTAFVLGGDSLDQCINNFVDSSMTFLDNAMPALEKGLSGIGTFIERIAPIIEEKLPGIIDKLLPPLLKASVALIKGLIKALPTIISTVIKELPDIVKQIGEALGEAFGGIPILSGIANLFKNNGETIAKIIPAIAGIVGAVSLLSKVKPIGEAFSNVFGNLGGGGGKGKGSKKLFGGIFDDLAQLKPSTIGKAFLNLTLILTGLTVLGAVFAKVSPFIAEMSDGKSLMEVAVLITVLGAIGTAFSWFAGIVGKIPISTVAKGLANMAIMIGGLTAVLWAVNWVCSVTDFNFQEILQVAGLISVLGIVGGVLSIFAGIVGMIPIPIVLTGLANMGLVLAGVTAFLLAYGKLGEVQGFNEFISKGGDTLANLFKQIGKVAGSLVGGALEGISNSLPTIGENLALFIEKIKPMFEMVKGVDLSGFGSFFSALGAFMLQMGGEKLMSFFTGGVDLADLGTKLNTFATNAKGFFDTVATYPELGFTNGTKFFECLSGISGLPNTGGLAGWFKGEIDYSKIAEGLGALSVDGVKNFFTMVQGIQPQAFDNAKQMFESLGAIDKLPTSGGAWGWISGEGGEVDNLTKLADSLEYFANKATTFFTAVNGLNLNNLNGLWESLKTAETITVGVSKVIDDTINDIVKKVTELPKKMGEGIKSAGQSLADSLVHIWKEAAKAMATPVNKILSGANWILEQFGSEKRVSSWTPYAKGTDGHKGGNALVNDGRGAELIQMPNGSTFIPRGRNVFIPNAPKGMKVLPAEQTASLLGKRSPTFRYADGVGDIDIFSYMDNHSGLIDKVYEKYVDFKNLSGLKLSMAQGMVTTVKKSMVSWVKKLFDEFGAMSLAGYVSSAGVEQWRSTVARALQMEGQYSEANVQRTLFQMQTESGGNPMAINLWDINAKRGIPSKGLMQVIDPTFRAYARPGFSSNIYDPLSNILASIRYAVSRYGSLARAYQGHGYANGGIATTPSIFGEDGAEMAIPLTRGKRQRALGLWAQTGSILGAYTPENSGTAVNNERVENNTYSPVFNLTISGDGDSRAMERKVKRWIKEAMDDTFANMGRKARVGV